MALLIVGAFTHMEDSTRRLTSDVEKSESSLYVPVYRWRIQASSESLVHTWPDANARHEQLRETSPAESTSNEEPYGNEKARHTYDSSADGMARVKVILSRTVRVELDDGQRNNIKGNWWFYTTCFVPQYEQSSTTQHTTNPERHCREQNNIRRTKCV